MSISLTNVVKRFGGAPAVNGVSAEIDSGAFFTVLGPSGCGKSTLLRLIAGLETLDDGEIRIDGAPVAGAGRHDPPEERKVGVVFQSYALWPHMTAIENVAFPIRAQGGARAAAEARAREHLATVALQGFEARPPAELSGGQRQRVALARCLAGDARVVLMDEPLANLDPHLRETMESELRAFHARSAVTTLYITHDQREAMALGSLVAVMNAGRFEQIATPETIYACPATEHVARFIGQGAIVDAAVDAVADGRAKVSGGGFEWIARCATTTAPGPARLLLRPEDIALVDPAGGRPGVIRDSVYRGGYREVGIATELGLLQTRTRAPVTVGETVGLRLEDGWVLPG
jgi:iron(III) transport system ATP-binding protein